MAYWNYANDHILLVQGHMLLRCIFFCHNDACICAFFLCSLVHLNLLSFPSSLVHSVLCSLHSLSLKLHPLSSAVMAFFAFCSISFFCRPSLSFPALFPPHFLRLVHSFPVVSHACAASSWSHSLAYQLSS